MSTTHPDDVPPSTEETLRRQLEERVELALELKAPRLTWLPKRVTQRFAAQPETLPPSERPTEKLPELEPQRQTMRFTGEAVPVASELAAPPIHGTMRFTGEMVPPAPEVAAPPSRGTMRFAGEDSWVRAQVQNLKLKPMSYAVKTATRRLPQGAKGWALIAGVLTAAAAVWSFALF